MPDLTSEEIQREILATELAKKKFELEELRATSVRAAGERAATAATEAERVAGEKTAAEAAETKAAAEKAEKAKAERQKAFIENFEAVSAGLTKLTGSSVTLPEKSVFREASVSAAALRGAAQAVAEAIRSASPVVTDPILVTGRTDQVDVVLAFFSFEAAVGALSHAAGTLLTADKPLNAILKIANEGAEDPAPGAAPPAAAPDNLAGAVVDVTNAILGLLTVDTTIETAESTTSEIVTHIAVIQNLLEPGAWTVAAGTVVLHETIGVPSRGGTILRRFEALKAFIPKLDAKAEEYTQEIEALGDKLDSAALAGLTAKKDACEASSAQISDFEAKATQTDATTGVNPLLAALRAQRLVGGDAVAKYVAVVLPARVSAYQVALKRRLFAPRIVVSASATIDLLVLSTEGGRIVAAGSYTAEKSFQVRFPMFWWGKDATLQPKYTTVNAVPFADD